MKTKITELFGIEHPIIQGGMHYVGLAELASAVSNAGGLGILTALTQPTRFVATKEAPVHPNVKDAIVAASELDTRLVMRPLKNTERVLNNSGVERLLAKETRLGNDIKFEDILDEVAGVYPKVMRDGLMDAGAWSCGMVAGLIDDVPSVGELIQRTMAQAEALIRQRLCVMLD